MAPADSLFCRGNWVLSDEQIDSELTGKVKKLRGKAICLHRDVTTIDTEVERH
jgi:hypothetical protein